MVKVRPTTNDRLLFGICFSCSTSRKLVRVTTICSCGHAHEIDPMKVLERLDSAAEVSTLRARLAEQRVDCAEHGLGKPSCWKCNDEAVATINEMRERLAAADRSIDAVRAFVRVGLSGGDRDAAWAHCIGAIAAYDGITHGRD